MNLEFSGRPIRLRSILVSVCAIWSGPWSCKLAVFQQFAEISANRLNPSKIVIESA